MPAGTWYLLPSCLVTLTAAFLAPSWPVGLPRRRHHGRLLAHGDEKVAELVLALTVPDEKDEEIDRTTTTPGVMPRLPPHADLIRPPPYLNDLAVGECVHMIDDDIRIVKVSHDPPIFYLPGFLHETDCRTIMDAVDTNILVSSSVAETKQGVVEHRTGSTVAWLGDHDDDETTIKREEEDDDDDDDPTRHATMLAGYLQHLTAHLFLPHALLSPTCSAASSVDAERLQVVRYDAQGKYDLHHDGYNRTVTVLTYLNGVAGTWFPFVEEEVNKDDENNNNDDDDDVFIPTMQLGNENMLNGRVPGRDGLCFVGREDNNIVLDTNAKGRVVLVDAGDAICFYNYQPLVVPPKDDDDDVQRRRRRPGNDHDGDVDDATNNIIMAWKTLHCGLPAPTTKWIATNWLSAVVKEALVPLHED
jgi:hypothetical protein